MTLVLFCVTFTANVDVFFVLHTIWKSSSFLSINNDFRVYASSSVNEAFQQWYLIAASDIIYIHVYAKRGQSFKTNLDGLSNYYINLLQNHYQQHLVLLLLVMQILNVSIIYSLQLLLTLLKHHWIMVSILILYLCGDWCHRWLYETNFYDQSSWTRVIYPFLLNCVKFIHYMYHVILTFNISTTFLNLFTLLQYIFPFFT
jgi:hypothetical protein